MLRTLLAGLPRDGCRHLSVICGRPIHLDMQATTPVDPRVLDAMIPFHTSHFGNPHSRTHLFGWESYNAVESARALVAGLISAIPSEIVFTSGATESNNLSIKGRKLWNAFRPDTGLVSVMAVNNEIGVIQPMEKIGMICRIRGVAFHTDAAQALGKIPIDVNKWNVSLMSLSAHNIYGPKGIGAVYITRQRSVRIEALINGGGQERGIRSGTVPTPLVVGFGVACDIAKKEMEYDDKRIRALQERLFNGIKARLEGVVVNGSLEKRYPGNLNLSFAYVEGESLLKGLEEVTVSSGSACTSAGLEPSYVLRALGVEDDMARSSIIYGIGRFTTEEEIDRAIKLTVRHVEKLREISPLR